MTEAAAGMSQLQARVPKDCLGPQKLERGTKVTSPESHREPSPADTLISDFRPPELRENPFLLCNGPIYGFLLQWPEPQTHQVLCDPGVRGASVTRPGRGPGIGRHTGSRSQEQGGCFPMKGDLSGEYQCC